MWEKIRMLAVCMFAMAWWSVFYPELCFTEETCEMVQTVETEKMAGQTAAVQEGEAGAAAQSREAGMTSGVLRASDNDVVISSRLLEWCEERLFDRKE